MTMHSVLTSGPNPADMLGRMAFRHDVYSASSPSPSDSSYSSGGSDSSQSSTSSKTSVGSQDDFLLQNHQESASCSWFHPNRAPVASQLANGWLDAELPPHERTNPRRTASRPNPPPLVRETHRKIQFVDHLVDTATHMVEVIWPLAVPACFAIGHGQSSNMPLRTFIEETLRRSKTSFSTLQVALYYLILIKAHVPKYDFTMEQPEDSPWTRALQCGRRMFLASLILASKYLQDRNYSARAWSKITGLEVGEINTNELAFLTAVNWKLHVHETMFERWQRILIEFANPALSSRWKHTVLSLNSNLDNVQLGACKPPAEYPHRPQNRRLYTAPIFTNQAFGSPRNSSPTTVVPPPSVLEPSLKMQPPPAPISRALPTPNLPSFCATPAVGFANSRPYQSLSCSAMSMAQSLAASRTVVDCGAPQPSSLGPVRRGSYASTRDVFMDAPDTPGSMVSDHSSQFSRSSSISSASGSSQSLYPLTRLATHNASAMKLLDVAAAADDNSVTILASSPLTHGGLTASPDLLIVDEYPTPPSGVVDAYDLHHVGRCTRKRHRSPSLHTVGFDGVPLQQKVCSILRTSARGHQVDDDGGMMRVGAPWGAGANTPAKKRACYVGHSSSVSPACVTTVSSPDAAWRPEGGPGMWTGIL